MRHLSEAVLMCCILAAIGCSFHASKADAVRDRHAQQWIEWLGPLKIGDSAEATIAKLAKESVLHGYQPLGGSGNVKHIFVLDDVTQMSIYVDYDGSISSLPFVQDREQWLKFPDGSLVSVVSRPELRNTAEPDKRDESRGDAQSGGPGGGGDEAR